LHGAQDGYLARGNEVEGSVTNVESDGRGEEPELYIGRTEFRFV